MNERTRHDERNSSNSNNFQQRLHESAALDEGTSAFAGIVEVGSLGPLHFDSHLLSRITSDNVCLQITNLSKKKVERKWIWVSLHSAKAENKLQRCLPVPGRLP